MAEVVCRRCQGTGEGDPASDRPLCWWCQGTGYVEGCSVEGCTRPGDQECEMCHQIVCGPHSEVNHTVEMILCFSCNIGLSEGISAAMEMADGS
jgi:hypothetical protein